MNGKSMLLKFKGLLTTCLDKLFEVIAPRAASAIIFAALGCNLLIKFYWAAKMNLLHNYFDWIIADLSVLLSIEVLLAGICLRWPNKWVLRKTTIIAAIVCAWSAINAGWVIRKGMQLLPTDLLPLVTNPLNSIFCVAINMFQAPLSALALFVPCGIALSFFFTVLSRPYTPNKSPKFLLVRAAICFVAIIIGMNNTQPSPVLAKEALSRPMRYNCQWKGITSLFYIKRGGASAKDLENATRHVPAYDEINLGLTNESPKKYNVVVIILEGVQFRQTSLYNKQGAPTPFLESIAATGAKFFNTRTPLTHTSKAIFSILTGRYPSPSQDLAEAVPAEKPYASVATILKNQAGYRTAFFQSAKGDFECRPATVSNLGFDKFFSRDDLKSREADIGYLACDEFKFLPPITNWIKESNQPFLLTYLCSVTHDPHKVPDWYGQNIGETIDLYRQTISYTDKFIETLYDELKKANLADNTIFCVIGDHGEAFGEHGMFSHARIFYEEAIHVVWTMKAPGLITPNTKINHPTSTIDFAPTLLSAMGYNIKDGNFDGVDALSDNLENRNTYFSCWLMQGPAGVINGDKKNVYDSVEHNVISYNLKTDPLELAATQINSENADELSDDILGWRRSMLFKLKQKRKGQKKLFDKWLCTWKDRESWAKYVK